MNLEINQGNLHLLIPCKVTNVSKIYAEEHSCSILEAMRLFYTSNLYKKLSDEGTKLWHLGAVALYEMWMEEKQ